MTQLRPYIETIGSGPDLVLIHGWGLHGGIWDTIRENLSQYFKLHIIDLPGFGRSPIPNKPYTIESLAEQIIPWVPENSFWLGWSLGGLLTTHVALNYPDKINKLVTVASNPCFIINDSWSTAMKPEVMHNFSQILEEDYEGTVIRFLSIQTLGSDSQKEDIKKLKDTVFIHGQPAPKALREGLNILSQNDYRSYLKDITIPHLRIYGKMDALVPFSAADAVQSLSPNSEHIIMEKASHAPFLSHPNEFISHIKNFLKE